MKLTILSDAEQKEEAVRAIVTAQHEIEAMDDNKIDGDMEVGYKNYVFLDFAALDRRTDACEWLSLCA